MKKSILFVILLVLCLASCANSIPPPGTITENVANQQNATESTTELETKPATEPATDDVSTPDKYPYTGDYCDDLWRSIGVKGRPWLEFIKDRKEVVGQEFFVWCSFMHEDENYSPKDYEFLFTVSDPSVAEITRKNELYYGEVNKVWLKGLKPGTVQLEFKMVHKETGGVYATYIELTIIPE